MCGGKAGIPKLSPALVQVIPVLTIYGHRRADILGEPKCLSQEYPVSDSSQTADA